MLFVVLKPLRYFLLSSFFVALLAGCGPDADRTEISAIPDLDIPYERFVLDNGLTLIVHEDHKAPLAAVHVWYHVGSKNEEPGRTGFAHLFEHLMFQGSENHNDEFFRPFEQVAANDYNLSVSSYVEAKDNREVTDITKLNAELKITVAKIDQLRKDIDAIVAEIEGEDSPPLEGCPKGGVVA